MTATSVALLVVLVLVSLYAVRKLRVLDRKVSELGGHLTELRRRELPLLYRQIEALDGIYQDLRPARGLPAMRTWATSPDFLAVIAQHALDHQPAVVVECGSGVSTIALARAAQINRRGHVYSLEHLAEFATVTREGLARQQLSDWATVIEAPLEPITVDGAPGHLWYRLDDLPVSGIDMLVIDGPPTRSGPLARYPAGPRLFERLNPGAAVFLDDAARADEAAVVARWRAEWPSLSYSTRPCEKGCAVFVKGGT